MGEVLAEHAGGDHSGSAGAGGNCAQRGDGANRSSFDYCSSDGRFADNFCSDSRVSEQFKGERILARVREQYICGEWAQEVAITALLVIVSIGISTIAAGTAKSGSTQAPANVSQETTNPVIEAAKRGDYDEIARLSTHNAESNKVMLGKYDGGGATSYIAKAGKEYTYFSLNEWDDVARIVGSQNMWKINQAFLDQQIALGKTFYTSHSIASAKINTFFYNEISYLKNLGVIIH